MSLNPANWPASCRERLDEWISQGAGQRLAAVFDFDNTLISGDIGEATLAWLIREGRIPVRAEQCPPFKVNGRPVVAEATADLASYYEALLSPTVHGSKDPTPLASGYVWAVQAMRDLTVRDVVCATEQVWAKSQPGQHPRIEVTTGGPSYPVPFFHAEMLELLAELLRNEFDVWIFSASNAWSVRWVVTRILNPELKARGATGIPAEHVIGITTLLRDDEGGLLKDAVLIRENPGYASLEDSLFLRLRLSSFLQFPVPAYSGKVAAIWDAISRRPFLGAGDSPGDLPMLSFCERRLWLNREGKTEYRRQMIQASRAEPDTWVEHWPRGGSLVRNV